MSSGSGVPTSNDCFGVFQDLKLKKKYKFIIFEIKGDKEIIVKETYEPSGSTDSHEELLKRFVKEECCYAAYDFAYESGEGPRNKIMLITWIPDTAKVRSKMLYASSKSTLLSLLGSILDVQATDYDEVDHKTILERAKSNR